MVDLTLYKQCIEEIRQYACQCNISETQTTQIFESCFKRLEAKQSRKTQKRFQPCRTFIYFLLTSIICLVYMRNSASFNSTIVRNLQNSIYPGLRLLRKLAVPIINHYPSLSELYDEWCLIENPYFFVGEMDCSPCMNTHTIPELTGCNISRSRNIGNPYITYEKNTKIDLKDIFQIYWNNSDIFQQDAARISCNTKAFRNIQDVISKRIDLNPSKFLNTHIVWRVNRMKPGRILRKLFSRPKETPTWWGQSVEKFILIDEAHSPPYNLPNPECSNVVVQCTQGARLIKMVPSIECLPNCKTFTVVLSTGYTLWYNWWYWRPVSFPISNATTMSINYLTSYC